MTLSLIWGRVWPILFAILFFGIIIALHEFGHFITAKLFGIRVNEYSIGMGPVLLKKKKGETQYSLRAFPVGGFVSLEGEDEDSEDPRAFGNQKSYKRFIVIAAGATLNIILGLILVCGMLGFAGETTSKTVSGVSENMKNSGHIAEGDEIVSINGSRVAGARDLYYSLFRDTDGKFDIVVKRNGEKIRFEDIDVYYDAEQGFCDFVVGYKNVTVLNILPGAVTETVSMAKLVYMSLIDMFSGSYGLKDLSGPVGTIEIVADTASEAISAKSYSQIFFILAFITINIGLVNLLPLPALDGGRLFFIFAEIIIRKPVPKKFEAVVHTAGLVLLLGLMVLITFSDIVKIVKK